MPYAYLGPEGTFSEAALRAVDPGAAHQHFHRVPGPHGDRHNVPGQRQWQGFGTLQARLTGLGQSGEHAGDVVHTERVGSRTREPDSVAGSGTQARTSSPARCAASITRSAA